MRRFTRPIESVEKTSHFELYRLPLSAQTVDATPSGIKQFSKVVFMKPGRRFGLSVEQKCDVWRRWKAGQTLHEIGRAFGKDHNSIRGVVARHGGIVPAVRRRALLARAGFRFVVP
jgi:hypothetical protein